MKTQLDEKQDLLRKIARLSSADEVQKVKAFIAGMEAGKAIREMECDRASWNALPVRSGIFGQPQQIVHTGVVKLGQPD